MLPHSTASDSRCVLSICSYRTLYGSSCSANQPKKKAEKKKLSKKSKKNKMPGNSCYKLKWPGSLCCRMSKLISRPFPQQDIFAIFKELNPAWQGEVESRQTRLVNWRCDCQWTLNGARFYKWMPSLCPRLPVTLATDKRGQQDEGHSVVRLRHFAVTFFYLTTRRAIASKYSYRGHWCILCTSISWSVGVMVVDLDLDLATCVSDDYCLFHLCWFYEPLFLQ